MSESRLLFHRRHPEVSLGGYMLEKRIRLGREVMQRRRIYLDQRFWIELRDVVLGRSSDSAAQRLLAYLGEEVEAGRAICPVSEAVFLELLKQQDESTKSATAALVDKLSLGVTLVPPLERTREEIRDLLWARAGADFPVSRWQLVWTKVPYVLGETHPSKTPFPPEEELAIQKAFADRMWDLSLQEMVARLNDLPDGDDWEGSAERLNAGNQEHRAQHKSFVQMYRSEFLGGLSLSREDMTAIAADLVRRGHLQNCVGAEDLSDAQAFAATVKALPTNRVFAACHAAVRWDQRRRLNGHDLLDFHHAQAALAYCDIFMTEKPLAAMLSQKHLGLDDIPCQIVTSAEAALGRLRRTAS